MPVPPDFVEKANQAIRLEYDAYCAALKIYNDCPTTEPTQIRRALLANVVSAATKCYNAVELWIATGDLCGANRNDFWAGDLANTAVNFLEGIPDFWQGLRRESKKLGLKGTYYAPSSTAYSAMQNLVVAFQPDIATTLERKFRTARLPVRGFTHPRKMNTRYATWERITMIAVAVLLVFVMLGVAWFDRNPSDLGYLIYRTILALLAGAFGAVFIPGLFEVKAKWAKWSLRASGATAFFLIVFFWNPPALMKQSPNREVQKASS
jgi:hypothetical protein